MDAVMEKYAIEKFDTRNFSMDNAIREQLQMFCITGEILPWFKVLFAVIGSRNISERER